MSRRHALLLFCALSVFVLPVTARAATTIVAGGNHTGVIKPDGSLWGWGSNDFGQIGDGSNSFQVSPVDVSDGKAWQKQSKGTSHTVALDSAGHLWAWGRNIEGQFGNGTNAGSLLPTAVDLTTVWTDVAAGGRHTLGIKSDGTLWGWGANDFGQVGDATTIARLVPVPIGDSSFRWISVSAGGNFSLALRDDGKLFAWGDNFYGQLGDASFTSHSSPAMIGLTTTWRKIAAGREHALAIESDSDALYGWGSNLHGELARDPAVTPKVNLPSLISTGWLFADAGGAHSGGIMNDGTLWMWGANTYGQLGIGSTGNYEFNPMQVGIATNWVALALGEDHSAALLDDPTSPAPMIGDQLFGFGNNLSGQVGSDPDAATVMSPAEVIANVNNTTPPLLDMTVSSPTRFSSQLVSGTMGGDVQTIEIFLNGVSDGFASLNSGEGTWSYSVTGLDLVNEVVVRAEATGSGLNTSSVSKTILYDNVLPTVSIEFSDYLTASSTKLIKGSYGDNIAIREVSVNVPSAGTVGPVEYLDSSQWQCLVSGLTPGANPVTVSGTDLAGNVGTLALASIVFDDEPPNAPTVSAPAYSNNVRPSWTWSSNGGGMLPLIFQTNLDSAGFAPETTLGSFTPASDLSEGLHTLEVQERDAAGNWSTSGTASVLVDIQAPAVSISSPAAAPTNAPILAYGATDGGSGIEVVEVTIDGTAQTTASGSPLSLPDGPHYVEVRASDRAGNVSSWSRVDFVVDTQPPFLGELGDIATNDPTHSLLIQGQAEPGAIVTVSPASGGAGPATFFPPPMDNIWGFNLTSLEEGATLVTVTAQDAAGNQAPQQAFTVIYDSIPPQVSIASPQDGLLYNSAVPLSYTVVEINELSREVVLDGPGGLIDVTGSTSLDLTDGTYVLTATVSDVVGQEAVASVTFAVDRTPPALTLNPVATPTNQTNLLLSGTMESGATVTILVDTSAVVGTVIYPTATTWSCPVSALAEGVNLITVTATDTAMNSTVVPMSVVFDGAAPGLTLNSVTTPTNQPSLVLGGTMESGATVTVSVNTAAAVGAVTYPTATTWSCPVSGLAEGANQFMITATDAAANQSTITTTVVFDSLAPTLTLNPFVTPTNLSSQILSGTRESGSTVEVTVDTTALVGVVDYPTLTTWSCPLTDLQPGANQVTVVARDPVGNVISDSQEIWLAAIEHSAINIDETWRSVTLARQFKAPVIIAGVPSYNDSEPGIVNIRNVTATGFELQFGEWLTTADAHGQEQAAWLALEPGRYAMPDGAIWEVGVFSSAQGTVNYTAPFAAPPAVFLTIQSNNNADETPVARVTSLSQTGFNVVLQKAENFSTTPISAESVGYLAIHRPAGSSAVVFSSDNYNYLLQSVSLSSNWSPVLSEQMFLEEEATLDAERDHLSEAVVVLNLAGSVFAQVSSQNETDPVGVRRKVPAQGVVFNAGQLETSANVWVNVPFSQPFAVPPVVTISPVSVTGGAGYVQIRNVTATGFEARYAEWDGAAPATVTLSYAAALPGRHLLGTLQLEAGTAPLTDVLPAGWHQVRFAGSLGAKPLVLASLQTANDELDPAVSRLHNVGVAGFDIGMQEGLFSPSGRMAETVGWIAVQQGLTQMSDGRMLQAYTGATGGGAVHFDFAAQLSNLYGTAMFSPQFARLFPNVTRAFGQNNFQTVLQGRTPLLLGDMTSTFDDDPATLRFSSLTGAGVDLQVVEQTGGSAGHASENLSLLLLQ